MGTILKAIKSPSATDFFDLYPHLREEFRVGEEQWRFWQAGGGYDRNLYTARAAWNEIHYVHNNPVRGGMCDDPVLWPWSSAAAYRGMDAPIAVDFCTWSVD